MQIGALTLSSNLMLSPLAGYTNLPFRLVVREIGGVGLCTTDLVNARSLLEKNKNALKLIETRPADAPLAVQLFGSVPGEMRDAAGDSGRRWAVSPCVVASGAAADGSGPGAGGVPARGKRNQNRDPPSGRDSHPMVPPQRSTVIRQK